MMNETWHFLYRLLGREPNANEMAWLDRVVNKYQCGVAEAHLRWMCENQVPKPRTAKQPL